MFHRATVPALLLAIAGTAAQLTAAAAADLAAGREKARQCVACHGLDGLSRQPNAPHIAGQSEIYLRAQLQAYRSGDRQDPQMSIIAGGLSDQDIEDLVAWYSAITIEATVPAVDR